MFRRLVSCPTRGEDSDSSSDDRDDNVLANEDDGTDREETHRERIEAWVTDNPKSRFQPGTLPLVEEDGEWGFDPSLLPLDQPANDRRSPANSRRTRRPDIPDMDSVHEDQNPRQWPLPSMRPAEVSSSYRSQQRAETLPSRGSSSTKSVKEMAKAALTILTKSAHSADPQTPATEVGDEDPTSAQHNEPQVSRGERKIVGLARHNRTDQLYVLVGSKSGVRICRLKSGTRVTDMTLMVTDETREDLDMVVSNDFVIIGFGNGLESYDLNATRRDVLPGVNVVDIAESSIDSVYSLKTSGKVIMYSVPSLTQTNRIKPYGQKRRNRYFRKIATCPITNRVAILSEKVYRKSILHTKSTARKSIYEVYVYSNNWTYLNSIRIRVDSNSSSHCLYLSSDELLVGTRGSLLLYVDFNRSFLTVIEVLGAHTFCHVNADEVLIATTGSIELLNLGDVRERSIASDSLRENGLVVLEDVRLVQIPTRDVVRFNFLRFQGQLLTLSKASEELLEIAPKGHVAKYVRDVSRPDDSYQLPLPEGCTELVGCCTTDEGEVVVISENGRLIFFSYNRQVRPEIVFGKLGCDVVCEEDGVYVLLNDELVIYTNKNDETNENYRLPLRLDHDYDPTGTRLAVHRDTDTEQISVFLLVPKWHRVLRMNLSDEEPSFTRLIHDPKLRLSCLAVRDEDGDIVLGGEWEVSNECCSNHTASTNAQKQGGLRVYSKDGELKRESMMDACVERIAFSPGGEMYIRTRLGLQYFNNV